MALIQFFVVLILDEAEIIGLDSQWSSGLNDSGHVLKVAMDFSGCILEPKDWVDSQPDSQWVFHQLYHFRKLSHGILPFRRMRLNNDRIAIEVNTHRKLPHPCNSKLDIELDSIISKSREVAVQRFLQQA